MNKKILVLAAVSLMLTLAGCSSDPEEITTTPPPIEGSGSDYAEYRIRQVLQCDPANTEGVDISGWFDYFDNIRLRVYFNDGEPEYLEYTDGDAPFSPLDFSAPEGKVECYLDREAEPNVLQIAGTGQKIALLENGAWTMTFRLDSRHVSYKYTFKTVEQKF